MTASLILPPKIQYNIFMNAQPAAQFLLHSKTEILRILRSLLKQRATIYAALENGQASLVTVLLLVDSDRELIALDYSPHPKTNERVLEAKKLFCRSKLDQLEVKFSLSEIKPAHLQSQPVFCAPFPQSLYYPQKRQFYRLTLSLPLKGIVKLADGAEVPLEVIDLGIGGVGLIDRTGKVPWTQDSVYAFRLFLPPGEVACALKVRSLLALNPGLRIGCAFVNLSPSQAMLIQRFLNQEQIKLKKLLPERP
jgi:c-di-GMP-binding flagellar brake protein YcgR